MSVVESSSDSKEKDKIVFVTVGTTQFNELIEAVSQESFLHQLVQDGFTKLIIQYGRGTPPPSSLNNDERQQKSMGGSNRITVEWFDFSPSLQSYMSCASVIVCHAGAGSIMESLSYRKKHTIVVINNELMDNHQLELAQALQQRNHIAVIHHPNLLHKQWHQIYNTILPSLHTLPPQPSQTNTNNNPFVTILHQHMGFPL